MHQSEQIALLLQTQFPLTRGRVLLAFPDFTIAVRSNDPQMLTRLETYFQPFIDTNKTPDKTVLVLDSSVIDLDGIPFTDWAREPGKTGRKDTIYDLEDGRLVKKVRTGMIFLQSQIHAIAAGPCLQHDNQVINFITSQHMNHLQQQGALICHASAVVLGGQCLAIAGLSGGGKSTLMLSILETEQAAYLTNDRLFIRPGAHGTEAVGIGKMPRVNPGTIINNARLRPLLDSSRQQALHALPPDDLWTLEEKYDVMVQDVYGADRICPTAPLSTVLILNWSRTSDQPCTVQEVTLADRTDLLPALMKSPGPFYQNRDGTFITDRFSPDPAAYLEALTGVTILEATGRLDFAAAATACHHRLRANHER